MYEYYEKARNAAGLKDYDVCKLTGISAGTLSDWKRGRIKALKADKLAKIAEVLDVTIEYLMTGEEEEKESVTGKKSHPLRQMKKPSKYGIPWINACIYWV